MLPDFLFLKKLTISLRNKLAKPSHLWPFTLVFNASLPGHKCVAVLTVHFQNLATLARSDHQHLAPLRVTVPQVIFSLLIFLSPTFLLPFMCACVSAIIGWKMRLCARVDVLPTSVSLTQMWRALEMFSEAAADDVRVDWLLAINSCQWPVPIHQPSTLLFVATAGHSQALSVYFCPHIILLLMPSTCLRGSCWCWRSCCWYSTPCRCFLFWKAMLCGLFCSSFSQRTGLIA